MSALTLMEEFSRLGIKIRPSGRNVRVTPTKALTPDLLLRIRSEKPRLIDGLEKVRRVAADLGDEKVQTLDAILVKPISKEH